MEIEPPNPNPNPNPNPSSPPPIEQPNPKRQKMSTTTSDDGDQITDHPTSIPAKPRYKRRSIAIFFAYCGVGYQGMQKNPGAKTIEGDLEEALFLCGAVPEEERGLHKRYDWARSARTDKGVSAVGQVVSGKFYVDPPGFIERLQSNLSPQIRIFGFKRATPSFNAKKFCDRRRYVYLLPVFALDPMRHRDRESVMASLGSGSELVKCLECSERGRKVFGVMGKSSFESKVGGGVVEVGSGDSSNSESALVEVTIVENASTKNDDTDSSDVVSGTGMKLGNGVVENEEKEGDKVVGEEADSKHATSENGIAENEKTVEDNAVGENGNGNGEVEKRSEFCYGDEVKERFNRILKYYEGTHNFHNFTTRTKAEDPAAKRYILSFNANTVVKVDGIEFVKCEVVGQSFMLHQIRKMIGLAVAIMRNYAPESLIETAFEQKFRITVPMAPEVGLYLDECFFPSYNKKWKHTHEELSMKDYAEEAEEFKLKYIYSHIASTEHKDGIVGLWLHSLNYRNYPDLRAVYNVDKSSDMKSNEVKDNNTVTVNASDNVDKSSDLKSNEVKDNDTVNASDNVDNSSDLNGNESVVIGPSSEVKVDDTVNASNNVDNSSDLNGKESVDKGPSSKVKDEDTVNASE